MENVAGKIVVITGASGGIGRVLARRYAARGANVALVARRPDELAVTAGVIAEEGGAASVHVVDIRDEHQCQDVIAAIMQRWNRLDVLVNNAGFEVQRSADGSVWEKIGWVDGHGTSLDFHHYVFEDRKPLKGLNYYRLQQVDYDGSMEYSPIVVVDMELSVQEPVIFPNPMGESAQVQLPEEWAGSLVSIFDAQGRLVEQGKADGSLMNLSGITSGVYIVKIQSGTLESTQRLVVK